MNSGGVGFGEVPRGMLSHWVVIKDGRIENYQAVVPSTWNAGPRNEQDQMGPYELSIIGTPVADPTKTIGSGQNYSLIRPLYVMRRTCS